MNFRPLLVALALAGIAAAPAHAAPVLWKVSDADSSIWLFGSIHLLPEDTEWRTDTLNKLLTKADRVYFETDLGPVAQPEIMALTMEHGFATDGRLLNARIDAELMQKVRDAAELYGVPVPTLLAMRPWLAASTISVTALMQAGYDPNLGVDLVLQQEVERERQGYLETAAEQIGFLAGEDETSEVEMLAGTLAEADRLVEMLDEMMAAWVTGNPEELADLFMADAGAYGVAFIDILINQRNENWTAEIETMLTENEEALLVVGAGHLLGEMSVVKQLEDKGFTAERVQ
ncbi:TraB/GumN family protein [Devosia sp. SD17-2]|jgi:uncharacterized protein YbaP (TraB family)|uniref:TraB/GumN family protein n=1 Tax=Devosia sp. SD17-2 TaxID=2976459 RepID=UPI0023D84C08|nr:TraB/GumN family protein [Devosia sp. SD17-2]WEJ31965.1 TraB/GumN family protein [Devosia sp. SD17-2]